jgi:hypothetical protein
MPSHRVFSHAVLVAAISLAVSAAPAAASFEPVFGGASTISASATTVGGPKLASADGAIVAVWYQNDGVNYVLMTARRAKNSSEWTTPSPLSDPAESITDDYDLVADSDGNFTAAWRVDATWHVRARTLLSDATDWEPVETIDDTGSTGSTSLARGPDGTAVLAWASFRAGENSMRIRTRAANSSTWGDPVDVDTGLDGPQNGDLQFAPSGNGLLAWDVALDGDSAHEIRAARYSHESGSWSQASKVTDARSVYNTVNAALSANGRATVAWADGGTNEVFAASTAAGELSWDSPDLITSPGSAGLQFSLAADRDGTAIVGVQQVIPGEDFVASLATSRNIFKSRDPETGTWSDVGGVSPDGFSGGPLLTVDDEYNIIATQLTANAFDPSRLADSVVPDVGMTVAYRPDGEDDFGVPQTILSGAAGIGNLMPVASHLDDSGNPLIAWVAADAGPYRHLEVTIGDATPPELNDISVPGSGTVGVPVRFTVSPFDLWSSVASTDWAFGDGRSAAGAAVTHTYMTAGVKTVTVTATDGAGHEATSEHQINIAAAPKPPAAAPGPPEPKPPVVKPPVLNAPKIEALLAGRRVTLNARVSLSKGKRCSGRAVATTRFGNRTYRTTLRLKTSGRTCRATGKIKLKKTPGARTKLRIKISSSSIKTRTLSTKRS